MPKPIKETTGEFKGWNYWPSEAFEFGVAGPFYFKKIGDEYVSRFRSERKHLNAGGTVHGGCLMTFADFALFAIATDHIDYYGFTVAFTSEFLSAPKDDQLIEARGEVLRAGGSIIFVRGIITADELPALNFSGTIKKLKPPT
ncbi:MAG: PaaI family thioesterase [Hellea sp.]|nr:PaaI family thioesterase [Hellea sp.]